MIEASLFSIVPSRPNAVDVQTNTTSGLRNHRASLQSIVDSFDRILFHADQEARRELWVIGTGVEQGWRGMGEVPLGHEVVSLENSFKVPTVNANGDSHDEVLRTFSNTVVDAEEIRAFKSLEAEAEAGG